MSDTSPELVAERIEAVQHRIVDAGGSLDEVEIVAVTKAKPFDAVRAALDVGLIDLGENYAQELAAKDDELMATVREMGSAVDRPARWHMIGRLQSNKIRLLAGRVALWQSVDRSSLVKELARRDPGAAILIQVDISAEPTKGGVDPAGVGELIESARNAGLDVRGLMGVAAATDDDEVARQMAALRSLCDRERLDVCSMGMSGDLEIAVAEGSTMVRVGSGLFGPRPPKDQDRPR